MKDYVKDLYKKLAGKIGEIPEPFHYDYFKLEGGELYYIGNWVKIDFVDWVLTYLWVK